MGEIPEVIQVQRKQIAEATEYIKCKASLRPRVGIICGTGMSALANRVQNAVTIAYDDIPHFPVSTVESHHGNLLIGDLGGQPVMMMQGRFHYYEGYSMQQVTFPVRVMKALGCEAMIVMNAVGSMNPSIPRGSLVFMSDMINMMGDNPLMGPNDDELGPRFPDMSEPFNRHMLSVAEDVALQAGVRTHRGVFIAVTGPCMETAAEYRFFRNIGADTIGMSSVPETIAAVHAGIKVLGLSTATDECYPDALEPAVFEEIVAVANAAEPKIDTIISGFLKRLDEALSED